MKYSVAILCGGRSTRMGQDKAQMQADGMRMADRLLAAFSGCNEILVSVRDAEQAGTLSEASAETAGASGMADGRTDPVRFVTDPVSDAGPLAGIVASLRVCRNKLLFAAAVDLPFIDRGFAEELLSAAAEGGEHKEEGSLAWDAAVPAGPDGRLHPLSAFYQKTCLPHFERCLADGRLRLRDCLEGLEIKKIPASQLTAGDRKLLNLNYPEDVQSVLFTRNQ